MKEDNINKLKEIFREVFELNIDDDIENARQLNCKNWDSLTQINLINAIESEFEITIDTHEYERFTSYSAVELLLEELKL